MLQSPAMRRLYSTLALSLLWLCPALGLTDTASTITKDLKVYGNCYTGTEAHLLTDEEGYGVFCKQGESAIFIISLNDTLEVFLRTGPTFRPDTIVSVSIKIDWNTTISRIASWNTISQTASIQDQALARRLLQDLARGKMVTFMVGTEGGHIDLKGSYRAIQDFLHRTGLQENT